MRGETLRGTCSAREINLFDLIQLITVKRQCFLILKKAAQSQH